MIGARKPKKRKRIERRIIALQNYEYWIKTYLPQFYNNNLIKKYSTMAINLTNETKKKALARFHAACSAVGLSGDQKGAVLASYNAESASDLSIEQLLDAAQKVQPKSTTSGDYWRKKVMGTIGGFLRNNKNPEIQAQASNPIYIKSIAVTAAGIKIERAKQGGNDYLINKAFNSISIEKLQEIYNSKSFKSK